MDSDTNLERRLRIITLQLQTRTDLASVMCGMFANPGEGRCRRNRTIQDGENDGSNEYIEVHFDVRGLGAD